MTTYKQIKCANCDTLWQHIKERALKSWNYCPNCGCEFTDEMVSWGYPDPEPYS